jgi:hypothetical protein
LGQQARMRPDGVPGSAWHFIGYRFRGSPPYCMPGSCVYVDA